MHILKTSFKKNAGNGRDNGECYGKNRNMQRYRNGFILVEVLLVLMIMIALIPVTIICIRPFNGLLSFKEEIQDQISLSQMRRILLLSYDIEMDGDELHFLYQEKERILSLKNNHLVLSPGTQIFLSEIEDAGFFSENECIYLRYERGGQSYEKVLVDEK